VTAESSRRSRILYGPRADPLDLGETLDHLLVGQFTQFGLGQAPIAEALRQIQDGSGLAPGQSETAQCALVDGCELASIWHPAAEMPGEAREDRGRRDH
jgi:hypothetical protein